MEIAETDLDVFGLQNSLIDLTSTSNKYYNTISGKQMINDDEDQKETAGYNHDEVLVNVDDDENKDDMKKT